MPVKPKKKPAVKKKPTAKRKASARTAKSAVKAAPQPRATGPKKRILIIDDDPALSRVMALKFQNAGLDVEVCHNGRQAIEVMRERKFDTILVDLIMPEKTGFDVLQERPKTVNAKTPIYVMSDMRTPETMDQTRSLGATNYFIKMQMPLNDVIRILLGQDAGEA